MGLLHCVLLFLFSPSRAVAALSGLDGNTFEVLHNQRPDCIRLNGIDCLEKFQGHGMRAKQAVSASSLAKNSPSRPTVSTSTSAPLGK